VTDKNFAFEFGDTVMIEFSDPDGGFQGTITDVIEMAGKIFLVYVDRAPKCVQYHQDEDKWIYGQYGIDAGVPCTVRKIGT